MGGRKPARAQLWNRIMIKSGKRSAKSAAGELIVPAMMLGCAGIYWMDAAGLSIMALAFPMALTAVIVLASCAVVVAAFASSSSRIKRTIEESTEGEGSGATLAMKTWSTVMLPVPLIAFWRDTGTVPALFLYVFCILLVLGERRRLWLVVVPPLLAVALVYLFKTVLYVRLPDIPSVFSG